MRIKTSLSALTGSRRSILFCLVTTFVFLAWHYRQYLAFQPAFWISLVHANPALSCVLFVPAYGLAVAFLLPTLPLNLLAGVLWGPVRGSALALAGSWLGAVAAFFVTRATFGKCLATRFDTRLVRSLQAQFERHGWKIVAFVRLNPIFPGPVNFLFGLTSIKPSTYIWATALFLAPPTVIFAVIGHGLGILAFEGYIKNLRIGSLIVGGAALLAALIAGLWFYARGQRQGAMSSIEKDDPLSR
jgi:uncharacterized membrane protein YdjX (TVP38/TMEM64 family)